MRGVAAHAGRAHHEGRSAILGLAEIIQRIEACNERHGVTVNCGRLAGGGALNVVPDFAIGSYNIRVASRRDREWIHAEFAAAATEHSLDVEVIWTSRGLRSTAPRLWSGSSPMCVPLRS